MTARVRKGKRIRSKTPFMSGSGNLGLKLDARRGGNWHDLHTSQNEKRLAPSTPSARC